MSRILWYGPGADRGDHEWYVGRCTPVVLKIHNGEGPITFVL